VDRRSPNPAWRGELYAALAAMGYGSAYVATAFALRSFDPLPIAAYRSLLAGLALAALIAIRRRRARPRDGGGVAPAARPGRYLRLVVVGILGGPIFLAGMNFAVAGVGATIASFVAGLYAILAAVLAPYLLREPLRPRALAGFVVALAGTALLAELDLGSPGRSGIAWGLLAAVSFALFLVLSRKWAGADGFDGLAVALSTMGSAAIGLGALIAISAPASFSPATLAPEALVALAWLAVVAASGQALAVSSLRLVPASRTAAFLLLNPITAAVLSALLLAQVPTGLQLVGGVLVLAGIAAATVELPRGRGLSSPG